MDTKNFSEGTKKRLERIKQLKNFDEQEALEYAISLAWLVTEHRETIRKVERK